MQIHEITRRNLSEGPLKGVASTPVNFGRTTVAMPQQSVAPSKVSFAPNMMPKAAPAATTTPGTNLAVLPQTTAVANTPGTGVATVPAGGAVTTAPRTGQVAPAANRVRPGQSDPNVIDVDAKDITNRQALASPTPQPGVATPVAQPTPQPGVATPVAQPAPAAKPVGLTPADMAKLRAQDKSKAPAPATQAAPEKAGFMRNAAEYFANKTMDKAGIPLSQQGQYHPGGHMAALQGTGTSAIQRTQANIVNKLANEYVKQGTLNRQKVLLTLPNIKSAAELLNQADDRLQLNYDEVAKQVMNLIKRLRLHAQAAAAAAPAAAVPAISVGRGQKPEDLNDPAMAQLLATAKKQGKI
jgi:hypothetical protein